MPAALILDDGELEAVEEILRGMGLAVERRSRAAAGKTAPKPQRLMITTAKRGVALPPFSVPVGEAEPKPVWICIHNQDFLPLRTRLRELGVDYLLQSALDRASLARFLSQLLYDGPERRSERRLSLGGEIRVRAGRQGQVARLLDLSTEACALLVPDPILPGTVARAVLPKSLGSGEELELEGVVARCEPHGSRGNGHAVVISLEMLGGSARKHLRDLTEGRLIGTRVTPLAAGSERGTAERRDSERHAYSVPVRPVGSGRCVGDDLVLGRDLSVTGVRIERAAGVTIAVDDTIQLALYGGAHDAPFVVKARAVRDEGERGTALVFDELSDAHRARIETLCSELPSIDALESDSPAQDRVIVSEIRQP